MSGWLIDDQGRRVGHFDNIIEIWKGNLIFILRFEVYCLTIGWNIKHGNVSITTFTLIGKEVAITAQMNERIILNCIVIMFFIFDIAGITHCAIRSDRERLYCTLITGAAIGHGINISWNMYDRIVRPLCAIMLHWGNFSDVGFFKTGGIIGLGGADRVTGKII